MRGIKNNGSKAVFKPRAPKPAEPIDFAELKRRVADDKDEPQAAKFVGNGVVKVFMAGPLNYYLPGNQALLRFLSRYGIEP
jgi:hypothetical protein